MGFSDTTDMEYPQYMVFLDISDYWGQPSHSFQLSDVVSQLGSGLFKPSLILYPLGAIC